MRARSSASDGVSEARIPRARSSRSAQRAALRLRNKGLLSVRVMPTNGAGGVTAPRSSQTHRDGAGAARAPSRQDSNRQRARDVEKCDLALSRRSATRKAVGPSAARGPLRGRVRRCGSRRAQLPQGASTHGRGATNTARSSQASGVEGPGARSSPQGASTHGRNVTLKASSSRPGNPNARDFFASWVCWLMVARRVAQRLSLRRRVRPPPPRGAQRVSAQRTRETTASMSWTTSAASSRSTR